MRYLWLAAAYFLACTVSFAQEKPNNKGNFSNNQGSFNNNQNSFNHTGPEYYIDKYVQINKIYKNDNDVLELINASALLAKVEPERFNSNSLTEKHALLKSYIDSSFQNTNFYHQNKQSILALYRSVMNISDSLSKEKFQQQNIEDLEKIREQAFTTAINDLNKLTTDEQQAFGLLNFINNEIKQDRQNSIEYQKFINSHLDMLSQALSARLEKTYDIGEIQQLFDIINPLLAEQNGNRSGNKTTAMLNDVFNKNYDLTRWYLGDLLLEGYKDYLTNHKRFPKNPKEEDVKRVYEFVNKASAPDRGTLKRNVLIAQMTLLERGQLVCNNETIKKKVAYGWNWDETDRVYRIPFLMFNRSLLEVRQQSELKDTVLHFNHPFYYKKVDAINAFNEKLRIFSKTGRIKLLNDPIFGNEPDMIFIMPNPPCSWIQNVYTNNW